LTFCLLVDHGGLCTHVIQIWRQWKGCTIVLSLDTYVMWWCFNRYKTWRGRISRCGTCIAVAVTHSRSKSVKIMWSFLLINNIWLNLESELQVVQ
jgi:hypothetical protein